MNVLLEKLSFKGVNSKSNYLIFLIAILFVVWCALFIYKVSFIAIDGQRYYTLIDDAMISMRYAWNLSHGRGLVWNAGERVEGYTNPLMTLYMAAGTGLFGRIGAPLFVRVSGGVFVLVSAYATLKIGEIIFDRVDDDTHGLVRVFSFVSGLVYYPLVAFALEGMETGMVAMWLLLAVWRALHLEGTPRVSPELPLLMGLAFLTRPDALVPIGLIALYRLFCLHGRPGWLRIFVSELLILGAIAGGQLLFRLAYYGALVPNTYALKVEGMPLVARLENGLRITAQFMRVGLALFIVAGVGLMLQFRKEKLLLLLLTLSLVGYQIWAGGDSFLAYGSYWRMIAPFMPLLFVLCLDGLLNIAAILLRMRSLRRYLARRPAAFAGRLRRGFAIVGLVVLLLFANKDTIPQMLLSGGLPLGSAVPLTNTALALEEITTPDAKIAVLHAGVVPYYLDRYAIDMLGKSDPYIAHLPPKDIDYKNYMPGHNKYDLEYSVVTLKPDYVEDVQWNLDDLRDYGPLNYALFNYRGIDLWLRKDSPNILWDKFEDAASS